VKTATTLTIAVLFAMGAVARENTVSDGLRNLDRTGDGKITGEEIPKLFDAPPTNEDGVAGTSSQAPARSKTAAARRELPENVEMRTVTIWSDGTRMAGDLYFPKNRKPEEKLPALVLCAGTGGTKGGTQARLGPIFAKNGYIVLAFDYRGWGASDPRLMALEKVPAPDEQGQVTVRARAVRWQMDFADQSTDVRAALSFLAGEPGVDSSRIGIWGSSYGGGLATWTAGNDPRVKCTVAQVGGVGAPRNPQAEARAFEYLTKQSRAEVEPVPFATGKMTGKMERYTQMRVNPSKGIGYGTAEAAEKITTPILFVVAENDELVSNANIERAASALRKRGVLVGYHVIKGITHYGIYKEGFAEATKLELEWFDKHLKGTPVAMVAGPEPAKVASEKPLQPAATAPKPQRSPEEAFKYLDSDANGKLTESEFGQLKGVIPYFRQNPDAIAQTFKKLDSTSTGTLLLEDYRRFHHFVLRRAQNAEETTAKSAPGAKPAAAKTARPNRPPEEIFAYLDTDADGKLSVSEFEGLGEAIAYFKEHPEAVPGILKKFDANGDGTLSIEEFRGFIERRTPNGAAPKIEPKDDPTNRSTADHTPPTAEGIAFFEKNIRPVLADKCYKCHSAAGESIKGGLTLDTREGIRSGGESGAAVVPGDLSKSLLIEAVRYANKEIQMPPQKQGGKLPEAVIANFEKWVQMGAPDPRDGGGAKVAKSSIDIEKGREHWAFQPVKKIAVPAVKDAAWPRSDIDRFLLAGMEERGVEPVRDAEPRALIRRVSFDLTGLPPTPEEVETFVADKSPEAFSKLVERLLASPQFGERWGRHWLDVARYADSTGRGSNILYPQAWRYRNYVIEAFNADKPYDQFVREQIAGDLLPAKDEAQRAEQIVATGFLALGPKQLSERDRLQFQLDVVDEQLDTLGQAMLGMTVGCARCHDHKFDPIPQRDYYAMAGILRSTETCYGTVPITTNNQPSKLIELPASAPRVESPVSAERLRAEQARLDKELRELTGGFGLDKFRLPDDAEKARRFIGVRSRLIIANQQIKELGADGYPRPFAMGAREKTAPGDMPLYQRGEPSKPADTVPRGFLRVLPLKGAPINAGSGRRELADWIASPENPLTARVMTNRIWHHLFGRGLVTSVDNFGTMGEAPSNPALLDYLTARFVEQGWSVKTLVREIMLTRAYQLGTNYESANYSTDPDNTQVWRMTPRRLDAEAARDAMLAVAGKLEKTPPLGSVPARIGDNFAGIAAARAATEATSGYRSVYLTIIRDQLTDALGLFDFANPNAVSGNRDQTTTPAQSLFLMNSPVMQSIAEVWSKRLLTMPGDDPARMRAAYAQAFGREPTETERRATMEFFGRFLSDAADDESKRRDLFGTALSAFCQALFSSAEFWTLN
jgi:dienelactone hydrolase/Ca2+-binding EF-hand superfamily protein